MKDVKIYFDWIQPINKRARARKTDPGTSHDAAKRVELGKAELQRFRIASALALKPMTYQEVAEFLGESKYEIGKRICELGEGFAPTGEIRKGSRVWGMT
jgi:hypothetical protein